MLPQRVSEALSWLGEGKDRKGIALAMGCSEHTVDRYLEYLYEKTDTHNRFDLLALAWNEDWLKVCPYCHRTH